MLHERGALQLWLSAGDVPDYALYTATWAPHRAQAARALPRQRAYLALEMPSPLGENVSAEKRVSYQAVDVFQTAKQCSNREQKGAYYSKAINIQAMDERVGNHGVVSSVSPRVQRGACGRQATAHAACRPTCPAPPATTVDAKRGVVTSGTAMLSFFLADPGTGDESGPHEGTAAAAAQAHAVPRRCA